MDSNIIELVMGEAAKSNVEKRKVGCVIVDRKGSVVSTGFNTDSVHAERAALKGVPNTKLKNCTVYVSQPPCPDCAKYLATRPIGRIEVVDAFMKFDGDKLRYDLIPPSATLALASVLTFGARKYKPHNWQQCEELDRYVAATYRHLEAWRAGEENDEDSGMPHLWHAITNLAFLIDLGYNPETWL